MKIIGYLREVLAPVEEVLPAEPAKPRLPEEWRKCYLVRPLERLPADVTQCFDRIHTLQREKDAINGALLRAHRQLGWANMKIWVLGLVVTGQGTVLIWMVNRLWEQMTR
jgi:hypothetical protein